MKHGSQTHLKPVGAGDKGSSTINIMHEGKVLYAGECNGGDWQVGEELNGYSAFCMSS